MLEKYNLNTDNTAAIGHSEGGNEATVVGIKNGLKTVTFNAYGVGKKYINPNKNYNDLVTNYRDAHDPVSKLRENVGTTYITPNLQNEFMSKTPFGSVQAHRIDNMGDCMQSVPVDDYKKSHPFFINKFLMQIFQDRILQIWILTCLKFMRKKLIIVWQTII